MKCLLPLLILIDFVDVQGILEWTVVGKVTNYGQNVTLFCNVEHCCPEESGWDRWTPVQQTLFIDVKTGRPNKKYDGKVMKDGYTLIIQNLTKSDLNVSYSCLYGVTLGERKFLLKEDVFKSISPAEPNDPNGQLSHIEISALIIGVIVLVLGSGSIFIYFCRRRMERHKSKGKPDNSDIEVKLLDTETAQKDNAENLMKITAELKEFIPKHIRDQIQRQIEDWENKDKMFVSTRASDFVINCLNENSCLTLTAPPGVGKSFIARHTALVLQKSGYKIVPVRQPDDIKNYYKPGEQTVFIVDDICGNFTANQQHIDNWKQLLPVIDTIITDTCCKIIVSCRLQVYRDDKFNILETFKSCECNLVSDNLCLTTKEKRRIANKYIDSGLADSYKCSQNSDFFPLLCSLYNKEKHGDVNEFFKNPFIIYQNELDNLSRHGIEREFKKCSLALLVLFNNQLREKWFLGKISDEQTRIIKDTCEACGINCIPKINLKKELDNLVDTFVTNQDGIYRTIHDKLFDFLAHYCGQKMIECLINHGDCDLVHQRFIWQKSDDKTSNIDFIIEIPDEYLELYLERFVKDWLAGKVAVVFSNNNMEVSSFRQKLVENLEQLEISMQTALANTVDTVRTQWCNSSGSTPLMWNCRDGYTDMVQWMLRNDVNVDQCTDDRESVLFHASETGRTDIVKLLLDRNANINLCNTENSSPLLMASSKGHTDIVNLLLKKNPYVNLCNKDDCSPLLIACQKGHTDIVKLLLEKNSDVNLCDKDGLSPLLQASQKGHTDIIQLLLERNPNVNICDTDGFSPLILASLNGHTDIVRLLLEWNPDPYDNTPQRTSYVNNKTSASNNRSLFRRIKHQHELDINAQTFGGGNALYFSALNGNMQITQLLLESHAGSNICIKSKQYITETLNNHPSKTLEEGKQLLFDSLITSTSSSTSPRVTVYVSNKSVDYAFDVVAGSYPLHIACFMGRLDVVRCLLKHNASINLTKEDGTTPLFYGCEVGHEDVVLLLLKKGADTQICRKDGKSPLGIATDNNTNL